jgi:HSP20 family protein
MKTQVNVSPRMIGSLLEDVFGNDGLLNRGLKPPVKQPAVNIIKTPVAYSLEMLVPGIDKELIHLEIKNNILKIAYDHKEQIDEDLQMIKSEFTVHSFERSFTLDNKMDVEMISAKYEHGILKINIPLKKEEQPKELKISIG